MALQPCDECGHEISTKAASCPNCGAPVGGSDQDVWCTNCGTKIPSGTSFCPQCEKPASGPAPSTSGGGYSPKSNGKAEAANKAGRGCLIGCLGLIALMFIIVLMDDSESQPASSSTKSFMAGQVCETYVKSSLKAPSTAEFGSKRTVSLGGNSYRVTGHVDAQNSFGAMIRNTYTCETRFRGGVGDAVYSSSNWTLESISVD